MNDGRVLEPALPAQPEVKSMYKSGAQPGMGLSRQKGASSGGMKSDKNVIPMGKPLPNSPGKGLGKTSSGMYKR